MANQRHLEILKQGVDAWNTWRANHSFTHLELATPVPTEQNDSLPGENHSHVDLSNADLRGVDLVGANLHKANCFRTNFSGANLDKADLSEANLSYARLNEATLKGAKLRNAKLIRAALHDANLRRANLCEADLREANLCDSELSNVDLSDANLCRADLRAANFEGANLSGTNLMAANLGMANLTNAILATANLIGSNLTEAILYGTDFSGASLVRCKVTNARISRSKIYGVNIWDLEGGFGEQNDLIISHGDKALITVDNIKVAQFIYLILNNDELRDVINTVTSKSVLILGRFALPERKTILDALRTKLREYDLLPIVFDFDRPSDKDFTETIKTLAGLSYFVIADITNPKSSPLELQATVPDYQIPFVPIIQEGDPPFAMMVDLQTKYNWVLNTVSYDSQETLMKVLKPLIIDPAMKKRQELRIIKAQEPEIISAKDYLAKGDL
jgi:uncharacterized protein YjbI with pentapeptide repeats